MRIKALTELGYTTTSYISRESNSTFNDDVSHKISDSYTHKKRNFHCEGCGNIIVSTLILNPFHKVKNQVWHKVRNIYKKYSIKAVFEIEHMHSFSQELIFYQICFETFQ